MNKTNQEIYFFSGAKNFPKLFIIFIMGEVGNDNEKKRKH